MLLKLDTTSLWPIADVMFAKEVIPESLLWEAIYKSVVCECGEFHFSPAHFYQAIGLDARFFSCANCAQVGDESPKSRDKTSKEGVMPRVTIDTTEAQSFEATEPGPYPMTIDQVDTKASKEKGVPMIEVHFVFDDPAVAKKCGHVIRNYMLAGKGAGFTREFLKAVTGDDYPIGEVLDFDTDDLLGKHVIVQVGNREYEGRLQNEAERIVAVQ